MYVCMYVCPKIYIRRALSKKVTVAPRSQTNRNVFSARLNRSVDKSDPVSSNSETPVLLVCRTMTIAGVGLRLLDTTTKSVSLAILGWGFGGRLGCGSLNEESCVTVIWSLQKLPGAICEERNLNAAF